MILGLSSMKFAFLPSAVIFGAINRKRFELICRKIIKIAFSHRKRMEATQKVFLQTAHKMHKPAPFSPGFLVWLVESAHIFGLPLHVELNA